MLAIRDDSAYPVSSATISPWRGRTSHGRSSSSSVGFQMTPPVGNYLFACRWPDGFRCPVCGFERAFEVSSRLLWQCSRCRHQVSVTAGTVLHKTRTPGHLWFWAAYVELPGGFRPGFGWHD